MKVKRRIIEIDEERCDGCGLCVPACAEGAIQLVNGKARLVSERYCDGLGACLGECPKDALRIIEREAEEFDEEAVEEHFEAKAKEEVGEDVMACGCPSSQVQTFIPPAQGSRAQASLAQERVGSSLSHWPVQIRLVPSTAPFLRGADLLVVADCTPVAYPNFHKDFLAGKVVMVGCPKFDEPPQPYVEKFAEIFTVANIHSVTVAVMEVPCCQGLPAIVKKAMDAAGKKVPMEVVVVSTGGEVLRRRKIAA